MSDFINIVEDAVALLGECHTSAMRMVHPGPHDHADRGRQMTCLGWPLPDASPLTPTGGPEMGARAVAVERDGSRMGLWEGLSASLREWEDATYKPGRLASDIDWDEAVGYLIPTLVKVIGPAEELVAVLDRMRAGEFLSSVAPDLERVHDDLRRAITEVGIVRSGPQGGRE